METSGPLARICCLDLDTFFVSVERLFRPDLVGKPVVIGALPGSRGVVSAASYEVRKFGVRSGMAIAEAYRLAPQATYLRGRHREYSGYASKVKQILERFAPVVRTASIDEFFLDFSHCERLYSLPGDADADVGIERAVGKMRQSIQEELGLPASAGVATSRPIAKIASGLAKPAGVRLVPSGSEFDFVAPLPVRKWPGIGPVAERKLASRGVKTLRQLLEFPGELSDTVRRAVFCTQQSSLGRDRPAFREHDPTELTLGSISNECTFSSDVGDEQRIRNQLCALSERVSWRLRKRGILARTITLKLRYSDFETLTRSQTIAATDCDNRILDCVQHLFQNNYQSARRVRLLGVGLSNLARGRRQLMLPFTAECSPMVAGAIDAVRERFGYDSIHLGMKKGTRWQS